MKARERFEEILLSCREKVQEDVVALIGKPLRLSEPQFRQADKESLLVESGGKSVLARIRIEGDLQGKGCLLIDLKDAIYLGGTLIMLPESELKSFVAEEEYSDELQDSFGEIANIICGTITHTFEGQYSKNVRFIRTEQEVVVPADMAAGSEQPIPDEPYYVMTVPIQLDGQNLGGFTIAFPAVLFGLSEAKESVQEERKPSESGTEKAESVAGTSEDEVLSSPLAKEAVDSVDAQEAGVLERPEESEGGGAAQHKQSAAHPRDVGKQKSLVDGLLKNCMAKISEEVSALMGGSLQVVPEEFGAFTKKDFFSQAGEKQVMARMDIRGGGQGEAFLFVELKTAVYLGGTLIMLPDSELEEAARNEDFGEDASDAYSEVANIIAGVYASIFEEQYRNKLGFVKTAIEPVVPVQVDSESDAVIPNQVYYLSACQLKYNGRDLGRLQMIIPASLLELQDLLVDADDLTEDLARPEKTQESGVGKDHTSSESARLQKIGADTNTILIFTDDDAEGRCIADALGKMGYVPKTLHFKDSVNSALTPGVQLVFLVMRTVSEQGFGMAIKISSAGVSIPLVVAGPTWTRTLVLKAVKYGACDILITPSTTDDVREKIDLNLVKRAA
jgi:chemotaxis protein CheY-P-specific phosphatase CheC